MSEQTLLTMKSTDEDDNTHTSDSPQRDEDTLRKIERILLDTALEVGALINAVCCRCGDWVDWQYYRPLPGIHPNNRTAADLIIRLALLEDIFGLRCGGYVEMRASGQERVIEMCGGYYDAYDQPEPVIEGSLRWDEVNHQRVGQVLLRMHDRIIRAHMAREMSDDSSVCFPPFWTGSTVPETRDSNGRARLKAVGIG